MNLRFFIKNFRFIFFYYENEKLIIIYFEKVAYLLKDKEIIKI